MIRIFINNTFSEAKDILKSINNEMVLIESKDNKTSVVVYEDVDTEITSKLDIKNVKTLSEIDVAMLAQEVVTENYKTSGEPSILSV